MLSARLYFRRFASKDTNTVLREVRSNVDRTSKMVAGEMARLRQTEADMRTLLEQATKEQQSKSKWGKYSEHLILLGLGSVVFALSVRNLKFRKKYEEPWNEESEKWDSMKQVLKKRGVDDAEATLRYLKRIVNDEEDLPVVLRDIARESKSSTKNKSGQASTVESTQADEKPNLSSSKGVW